MAFIYRTNVILTIVSTLAPRHRLSFRNSVEESTGFGATGQRPRHALFVFEQASSGTEVLAQAVWVPHARPVAALHTVVAGLCCLTFMVRHGTCCESHQFAY